MLQSNDEGQVQQNKNLTHKGNTSLSVYQKKSKEEFLRRITVNANLINLTDLWRESGSDPNKKPIIWKRQDYAKELILSVCKKSQSDFKSLWKTYRGGKNPGTYAHKSIALSYAKYLDSEIHVLVNEVFFERIEEEKNPDLIADRAIEGYKKMGKSDSWISKRIDGKTKRSNFTSTLASHGVVQNGFRNCTNAIYIPLFGGTTSVIKDKKNLPANANVRDNMSEFELDAVKFAESLSVEIIRHNNLEGNAKCEIACTKASKNVADAIIQAKKAIQ
jgi:KilA-N domain